jgi:hypothetical protein
MKLLQAFESFMLGRLIVEIGSENWLTVGRTVRQRKLVRCRLRNSAAKTGSLQAAQFVSKNWSATSATISAANATSLQPTCFWQWMLICYRQLNSGSESQIRCRQYNFSSESQIRSKTHNSRANVNSLQTTQFRQRISNEIRCRPDNFGSESQILFKTHNSAANVNSLQTTQFRQWISNSL